MESRRSHLNREFFRELPKQEQGFAPSSESERDPQDATEEFRRLSGSFVGPLLRDGQGGLDLALVPAKNFTEFKKFLQDQAAQNDGMSFRNPYEALLKETKYEPLLRSLWERRAETSDSIPLKDGEGLLKDFQSECIRIDADRFVSLQLSSGEGRQKLRGILRDAGHFDKDRRSDLVKAIAKASKNEGMTVDMQVSGVTDQISSWNLFNLFVTDEEISKATLAAQDILDSVDFFYKKAEKIRNKEIQETNQISLLSEEHVGRKITREDYQRFSQIQQDKSKNSDPISKAQAQLAGLWLLAANNSNWTSEEHVPDDEARAHVLRQAEALLASTDNIKTEQDFILFAGRLQGFLKGPIHGMATVEETAGQRTQRDLVEAAKFHLAGATLPQLFSKISGNLRDPYQQIVQLSDAWSASIDMGERIRIDAGQNRSSDIKAKPVAKLAKPKTPGQDELRETVDATDAPQLSKEEQALRNLIEGLEKTKHELWAGYKQHKTISRILSAAADQVGAGDRRDIRKANQFIDQSIERLSRAKSKPEMEKEIRLLFQSLEKGGVLYQAFAAAEMDGIEQALGLVQSAAIALSIGWATKGLGTVAQIDLALMEGAIGLTATQVAKGFAMGAATMTAENALAVASKEARQNPDTLEAWMKDAAATGLSMSITGALPASQAAGQSFVKNIWARYTAGGLKGLGHLGKDAVTEVFEESIDQVARQAMDKKYDGMTLNELREIASVSALGGVTKVGSVAEMIKSRKPVSKDSIPIDASHPSISPVYSQRARQLSRSPWLAPMWMAMGTGGIGGGSEVNRSLDEDPVVGNQAFMRFLEINKNAPEAAGEFTQKILERLDDKDGSMRQRAAQLLTMISYSLEKKYHSGIALKLAEHLWDEDPRVKSMASLLFIQLQPALEMKDRYTIALQVEQRLVDGDSIIVLANLIGSLEAKDRLPRVLKITEKYPSGPSYFAEFVDTQLKYLIEHLEMEDRSTLVLKIQELTQTPQMNWKILELYKGLIPSLARKAQGIHAHHYRELSGGGISSDYVDLVAQLAPEYRMPLATEIVDNMGLSDQALRFIGELLQSLPKDAFSGYAKAQGRADLIALARFNEALLPLEKFFYDQYLASTDPDRYLRETSEAIDAYRRGKVLASFDKEELRLAHAGLDAPSGLPFNKFEIFIQKRILPPLFLDRSFKASLREIRSFHDKVDKGKIHQALTPIQSVETTESFGIYLRDLVEREAGSLKSIKTDLREAFPEGTELPELLEGAQRLLTILHSKKTSPPLQDLMLHLALLLAWHREGIDELKQKMAAAKGRSIPSQALWEGLQATEEFYRDTVGDVLRDAAIDTERIPELKKQRKLLAAELDRAQREDGEVVEIDFLPSKSQTDQFFGYVGEDCTKNRGDSIYRQDFQVYRLIANGRLSGMLYLQHAVLDGKRVLVMAVQPRSFWQVDHKALLKIIEERFSKIAEEEGYDALLFMESELHRSNRKDMMKAIEERDYPPIRFKVGISGAVFNGPDFSRIWERPSPEAPLPLKGPLLLLTATGAGLSTLLGSGQALASDGTPTGTALSLLQWAGALGVGSLVTWAAMSLKGHISKRKSLLAPGDDEIQNYSKELPTEAYRQPAIPVEIIKQVPLRPEDFVLSRHKNGVPKKVILRSDRVIDDILFSGMKYRAPHNDPALLPLSGACGGITVGGKVGGVVGSVLGGGSDKAGQDGAITGMLLGGAMGAGLAVAFHLMMQLRNNILEFYPNGQLKKSYLSNGHTFQTPLGELWLYWIEYYQEGSIKSFHINRFNIPGVGKDLSGQIYFRPDGSLLGIYLTEDAAIMGKRIDAGKIVWFSDAIDQVTTNAKGELVFPLKPPKNSEKDTIGDLPAPQVRVRVVKARQKNDVEVKIEEEESDAADLEEAKRKQNH